ncbi:hypothetical protein EJ02DRAFT_200288 [Clathrospora elynae]|uniref:Histone deacetylase complex subunit SAP30 Sin3 binding domain-containing protein n=1 Tax=Clathrospora elynae TaxID=706981 RepID=A0A6A5T876_9PLEO|nr:hypothetical protein EJ02DRAFT_200288 [Clathrospora elynae]
MPPKRIIHDEAHMTSSLKDNLKEQHLQGASARGRRNGGNNAMNGSSLKDVDNASSSTGQTASDPSSSSNITWSTQDTSVLQAYRRAHRLDCPSAFKNPLAHVVLSQGVGLHSPTMARKSKRRVEKSQLSLAVRKHFNASLVVENDVIVNWLYASKQNDKEFRIRFAPQRR